jgi:hypothetical protein
VNRSLVLALALALLSAACSIVPCDAGQELQLGVCVPAASAGETQGQAGAPAVEGGDAGEGTAAECSPSSQFGDPCTSDAECHCPTNYCALQPGQSMGNCTHSGCLEDPSVCPADHMCVDLSVFSPTLPSICIPS